ncbi:MAG: hypothetical protein ACAI35_21070 [Candidatus Methylacidiphilales bacterium]
MANSAGFCHPSQYLASAAPGCARNGDVPDNHALVGNEAAGKMREIT